MKKILLFGGGKQGKKYYNFFRNLEYNITLVTKSGKTNFQNIENTIAYNDISKHDLKLFGIIIIAVSPSSSQDDVITYVLQHTSLDQTKIIIEKPVTYNQNLLQTLIFDERVYFFFDETYIFHKTFCNYKSTISTLDIHLYNEDRKYYENILEHAISIFFTITNFQTILDNSKIVFHNTAFDLNTLKYTILLNKKLIISCVKGFIYINGKHIGILDFGKALKLLFQISKSENFLIKENFLNYRTHYYKKYGFIGTCL